MAKPLNLKVDHSGKTTLAEQIRSECENASRVSARDVAQTSNLMVGAAFQFASDPRL